MGKKIYMNKLPLALFIFVVSLAASGTATAVTDPGNSLLDAYVVESGKMYTGPTALQDSIDSDYTQDGYNIYLQPGNYSQPITIDKNLRIRGMGANPEDTVIELNTDGSVVNVHEGVTVTLKNMAIINRGSGTAISDSGVINMINCVIIDSYMVPPVNTTEMNTSDIGWDDSTTAMSTDLVVGVQSNVISVQGTDFTKVTDSTVTESSNVLITTEEATNPVSSENTTQSSTPLDNSIPLTTMAYGMLMVVGGVVLPRKNY